MIAELGDFKTHNQASLRISEAGRVQRAVGKRVCGSSSFPFVQRSVGIVTAVGEGERGSRCSAAEVAFKPG